MNWTQACKQAWNEARQHSVYTSLYIAGVALAIALTMIFGVIYFVKMAPIYPEYNRANTYSIEYITFRDTTNYSSMSGRLGYNAVKEWFYTLKNVEHVTAMTSLGGMTIYSDNNKEGVRMSSKGVDPDFFKVFNLEFVEGKPFTEEEQNLPVAVITDRVARQLFGTDEGVTGRTFKISIQEFVVKGVVKEASRLTPASYSQVYYPYMCLPGYDSGWGLNGQLTNMGNFLVYMTVKDDDQVKALKREVQEIAHKFNTSGGTVEVNLYNQPSSHFEVALRESPTDDFSWSSVIRRNIIILLVLLLIPSLNLSGMIAGRMESRMSEMGIRKSYGAGSGILMKQVLFENFLWTVAGGVIGLAAAWIVLALEREWIFKLFENNPGSSVTDVHLSGEMLFSPAIFGGALVLCLMLNLMSAFIPTWRAMRRPIVTSLYEKR